MDAKDSKPGRIRRNLTYANVVATIALFGLVGGGGAWAASKITSKDIAKDAVRSKQVKNNSLKSADFKAGQLPAGDRGPQGPQGPQGASGAAGATNVVMRQGAQVTVPANSFNTATASCQPGEVATGGGVYNESQVLTLRVTSSYPTPNPTTPPATGDGKVPTGWRVWMGSSSATPEPVNAYVICASP